MQATIERPGIEQPPSPPRELTLTSPDSDGTPLADAVIAWLHSQPLGAAATEGSVGTETESTESIPHFAGSVVLPRAVRVQDLREETRIQARYAAGLGRLAIGQAVERQESEEGGRVRGLLDAVEHARRGDNASLTINVMFAMAEAVVNEGVMPDSLITRDENGELEQNGQRLIDVQANAIRFNPGEHPEIHNITRTNAVNLYALDELDRAGRFDHGEVWVVPSLVAQGASGRAVRRYGNFENLDVSWQFIWKEAPGVFRMRTMFVAGVDPHADEEAVHEAMTPAQLDHMYELRLQRRHDIAMVSGIYTDLNMPVPENVTGFLRGFLMRREDFNDPDHPEADMAARYDEKLGPGYYLGRKGQRQDYVADGQRHAVALAKLHERVPMVVAEMVARLEELTNDMDAARLLYKLASRQAVDHVIDNPGVLAIFGPALGQAAHNAILAFHQGQGGDREDIHSKARPNTCGFGKDSERAEDDGDCEFTSKKCPQCGAPNVRTIIRKLKNGTRHIEGACGCKKIVKADNNQ